MKSAWLSTVTSSAMLACCDAAEFGALPAIQAGLARQQLDVGRAAGDQILLAGEVGHPEAVDDVVGLKRDLGRDADRQMKLVRGADDLRRVAGVIIDVPPPLVGDDLDRELRIARRAAASSGR